MRGRGRGLFGFLGLLFGILLMGPAHSQGGLKDYWLLDEFLAEHPQQQQKLRGFSETVQQTASTGSNDTPAPVRIVMVYPGAQVSDYWRRSVSSFQARMQELKLSHDLEDHFTRPGTEVHLQSRLIGSAMEDAPDYLVFTLDAMRHRGMIERVMARGRTKVILQNITTPLRAFTDHQPFLYVGFDHEKGTKLLAKRYREEFPTGARYAIFYGPKGYVSQMRGGVFLQEMSRHTGMQLVASYYVNFDREKSRKAALELLAEQPDLQFIYACSTDIAHGITDALKETGRLGQVKVNGWGGGQTELDAIAAGEIDFTVMRMNDDNGVAMAEAIRLDMEGKGSEVPLVYSGEFRLVDKETSPTELSILKQHAFRYSN